MKKLVLLTATMFFLCASAVTIAAPLAPEMCFSATGLNISVNWTSVPDATGYTLYYAPYPYEGEHTIGNIDMGAETSASYYLWENANYYISATSRDASGESPYSNIELFQLTPTSSSASLIPCQTAILEGTWGNGVTNMALMADGSYLVDTNNDGVAEAWGSYDATENQLELADEGGTSACFDVATQEFIVGSYAYAINQEAMTLTLIDDGCSGRAASMTAQWDQDDSPSSSIVNPSNGKTNSAHIDNDGDGYSEIRGDCNDNNSSVHPGATEICGDRRDNNCDSVIDENCSAPVDPDDVDDDGDGYTENQGDCNDVNQSINPSVTDICGDGIDQNCDGYDDNSCQNYDLTGSWSGTASSSVRTECTESLFINLVMTGTAIRGNGSISGPCISANGSFTGVLNGSNVEFGVVLTDNLSVNYTGTLSSDGQSINGTWAWSNNEDRGPWIIRKQ